MKNNDFKNKISVSEKDLIPIEPLEKCLWTMNATGKIADFGLITRRNIDKDHIYGSHYWAISHLLGELEYKLREGELDRKQFEDGCNRIYDRYNVNFDMLRNQLSDLENLKQEHTPEKEDMLSTKFNTQTREYLDRIQNQKLVKQEHSQQHEDNLQDNR